MNRNAVIAITATVILTAGCTSITSLTDLLSQLGITTTQTGGGTDVVPSNIGAAIAALFSGGEENSAPSVVPAGDVSPDVGATCRDFELSGGGGPDGVNVSATVAAGTYGASTASVTLTAADDCESDNTSDDSYAAFEVVEDVVATCENGQTVTMLPGSAGVYRTNEAEGHYPEIYGTFNLADGDGNTFEGVTCTIFLDDSENVLDATCEDADGDAIEIDTGGTTCQFQTN